MPEKELEKYLVNQIKKRGGGIAYKFISPGNDGVPDRIVVMPGRPVIFVELKTARGKLTPLQQVQISRLGVLGQQVRVLRGRLGVDFFLDTVVDGDGV